MGSLCECQDVIKKESWAVLSGKDNRPTAPGKVFILDEGWGYLMLLLLIARSIMAVNRLTHPSDYLD